MDFNLNDNTKPKHLHTHIHIIIKPDVDIPHVNYKPPNHCTGQRLIIQLINLALEHLGKRIALSEIQCFCGLITSIIYEKRTIYSVIRRSIAFPLLYMSDSLL